MTARRSRETTAHTSPPDAAALPAASSPTHALQQRLGHFFSHPDLLELALTHRSFAYESRAAHETHAHDPAVPAPGKAHKNQPGTDNEQLEFLGDAILGLCVAEALYREFPQCTEGELTRMRAALVSRPRMAQMGAALGLGEHLRLGRSAEQNGGRHKPALLANAAEAVLAAVYLDAGSNPDPNSGPSGIEAVCKLVEQHLLAPEREAMRSALARDSGHGALRDHKTLLQERVQAAAAGKLRYLDIAQSGPPHQRIFAVQALIEGPDETRLLAAAEGSSKKEAQQRAAELALAAWDETTAAAPAAKSSSAAVPSSRRDKGGA